MNWIKDIVPASLQWWFLNIYLIWAHYKKRKESLSGIIVALCAKADNIDMPITSIKNMRCDVFNYTIQYAKRGFAANSDGGKGKYKLLYRSVYCGISGPYFKVYKKIRNLLEIK